MKFLATLGAACAVAGFAVPCPGAYASTRIEHVLVVSIDGLHAVDLRRYMRGHAQSELSKLAADGIEYSDAHSAVPADSFPGLIGMFTGTTPAVSGVYYDVSYDRSLAVTLDDCHKGHFGASVIYNESIDAPSIDGKAASIDPHKLPLRAGTCTPVYPHDYLRSNTVFEVVRAAGGYTAWIDKHPAYEILNGPSGHGVEDLYTPEIGGDFEGTATAGANHVTGSLTSTEAYDAMKADALVAEIEGWRHDRSAHAPVPTLFGTNLQSLNVAQKLDGYASANGTPSAGVTAALDHCDQLLARIVGALRQRGLYDSTLLIVTAKHGNAPIDRSRLVHVDKAALRHIIDVAAPGALAQLTADQAALIWLRDRDYSRRVAQALRTHDKALGIRSVLASDELSRLFPGIAQDSRAPDIVVIPHTGVIYGKSGESKLAEHGGFDDDDTHVGLLIANPHLPRRHTSVDARVSTLQIAPTILFALGIPTSKLEGVAKLGTQRLPLSN